MGDLFAPSPTLEEISDGITVRGGPFVGVEHPGVGANALEEVGAIAVWIQLVGQRAQTVRSAGQAATRIIAVGGGAAGRQRDSGKAST